MNKDVWKLTTDEFFDSIRGRKKISQEQQERFFKEIEEMIKQSKTKHGAR